MQGLRGKSVNKRRQTGGIEKNFKGERRKSEGSRRKQEGNKDSERRPRKEKES